MRLLPLSSSCEREKVALVARLACLAHQFHLDWPGRLATTPYLRAAPMNIARMTNGKCEKGRIRAGSNRSERRQPVGDSTRPAPVHFAHAAGSTSVNPM